MSDIVLSRPALFKGTFTVDGKPADTFLDMHVSIIIHYVHGRKSWALCIIVTLVGIVVVFFTS